MWCVCVVWYLFPCDSCVCCVMGCCVVGVCVVVSVLYCVLLWCGCASVCGCHCGLCVVRVVGCFMG